MNMFYIWPAWLLAIVATFAGLETYAIKSGTPTLSRFIWTLSEAWPPFPWIAGFITGFLVCHFWWGGIVSFKAVSGWLP